MSTEITERPAPLPATVVQDDGPLAYLMDTARFNHMYRIAQAMAMASLLPDHLRDRNGDHQRTCANCFLVVNQAIRWGFDPFAVAPETYAVGGKLGFQGKLVAAVVNSRAGLKDRLSYSFSGEGENRTVLVSGTFKDETEPRIVSLIWKDAKTNNDMWKKDPDQKLIYTGSVKWARRHCPEVVLGVLTDDDVDRIHDGATVLEVVQELPAENGHTEPAPKRKRRSKTDEMAERLSTTTSQQMEQPQPGFQPPPAEGAPHTSEWHAAKQVDDAKQKITDQLTACSTREILDSTYRGLTSTQSWVTKMGMPLLSKHAYDEYVKRSAELPATQKELPNA